VKFCSDYKMQQGKRDQRKRIVQKVRKIGYEG